MSYIRTFAMAFGIGLTLGTITVVMAKAATPAVPKIFNGAPMGKGQWGIQMLEGPQVASMAKSGMGKMSICMDAAREMAEGPAMKQYRDKNEGKCSSRVLKDTVAMAQVETICPDHRIVATIVRESARSMLITAISTPKGRKPETMKMRYTYEGACSASGPVMKADKNSQMCKTMKAQMAGMDPNMCAKLSGQARTTCEQQMGPALKQMREMCQ